VVARASDDEALAPGELSGRLRAGDHVFGTALEAYAEALALPAGATGAGGPASPRAATVARIGAELAMRGEFREVHNLAPAYLRRTEAEVNLDRKASRG